MDQHPTRRTIVVGSALTLAAMATVEAQPVPPPAAPDTLSAKVMLSGHVMEIAIGTADKALPDVLVSNGRDIVRTDASGGFTLSLMPGQTIFVVKPAGFMPKIDPVSRLAHVAYVHDPEGTPTSLAFRYGGLPPTGAVPVALEFHFTRVAEPDAFDVLLFTDPQPESTVEIEFVRDDVVSSLIGSKAAFGITCGDLMFDDLSMYGRYNKIIGTIGLPWWNIGGNHDLDYEAPDAKRSRDTWKRVFGATYYAFEHGKALFVMLDNVDYLGAGSAKPGGRSWKL